MKLKLYLLLLLFTALSQLSYSNDIVIHNSNPNSHELVYLDPPQVTYDEGLNELTVYFGSSGTIDLECDDGTGTPYYYVYGEYHPACDTATYSNLPPGYYTITIHSVYGITYTGNFTVN